MNPYTHRYNYVSEDNRKVPARRVLYFLLGLIFGGVIGFGVGASYNQDHQKQTVIEHRVVVTRSKPPVTCKIVDARYGSYKPYEMFQCSDGTIKVIYT